MDHDRHDGMDRDRHDGMDHDPDQGLNQNHYSKRKEGEPSGPFLPLLQVFLLFSHESKRAKYKSRIK